MEIYLSNIIDREIGSNKGAYVSIFFTDNEQIKEINRDYRGKDYPTNVLSFAYQDSEDISNEIINLGEVIVSNEKVEEDAKILGKSFIEEMFFILTHGTLHLLGYDHIEDDEAEIMEEKERIYMELWKESNRSNEDG